jgi:hypothetical protein
MKTPKDLAHDSQETIEITLSKHTVEDLKRIALFYEITLGELVQEYLVNSIDNDSQKARRVEFERNLCKKPNKKCDTNIAKEIRNDSSLML